MSTTNLYRLYKSTAREEAEWHNSWLSAPPLWDYLCRTFLLREPNWFLGGDQSALWNLVSDARVPEPIRLAHAFTMDGAMCPKDRIASLATALNNAGGIISDKSGTPTHWPLIGRALTKLHQASDKRMVGVALSCTSVSDGWIDWSPKKREPWDIFPVAMSPPPDSKGEG